MSETQDTGNETSISVCDIMKENVSEITKKLESQSLINFQQYSDLYSSYLHTIDDVFGTCYIAEKEFFDKLNIDPQILKGFKESSDLFTKNYLEQIDLSTKYFQNYVNMRKVSLDAYDKFMHALMESYAKSLSQFSKLCSSN